MASECAIHTTLLDAHSGGRASLRYSTLLYSTLLYSTLLYLTHLLEPPTTSWIPPPDGYSRPDPRAEAKLSESPEKWFVLQAGDAVVMEPTCWHRGGANESDNDRSLLALSFVAAAK